MERNTVIDSQDSTLPSGTSIIIPIKRQDRQNFESEVFKATLFWPMKPVYKNFMAKLEDINLKTIYDDENFLFVQQRFFNSGYGLLLDGIYYPISSNIIDFASHTLYNHLVIFKFNVGELTISSNRETLQYDDKTKTIINKRFIDLLNVCKDQYYKEFMKQTTWLQATLFDKRKTDNFYWNVINAHIVDKDPWFETVNNFNGTKLNTKLESIFKTFQFFNCKLDDRNITRTKMTSIHEGFLSTNLFLFDETQSNITAKDLTIFNDSSMSPYIAIKVAETKLYKWSELSFKEKKTYAVAMRYMIKDIENLRKLGFTFTKYSTVQKAKVKKNLTSTKTISNEQLKVFIRGLLEETNYSYARRRKQTTKPGHYTRLSVDDLTLTIEGDLKNFTVKLVDDTLLIPSFTDDMVM